MTKYGYLRKDDDGHDFLIPEEEIEAYDADMEAYYNSKTKEEMWKYIEILNNKYWKYAIGGSIYDLKVLIE